MLANNSIFQKYLFNKYKDPDIRFIHKDLNITLFN